MKKITRRSVMKGLASIALLGPLSVKGLGKVVDIGAKVARSSVTLMRSTGENLWKKLH